MLALHPLLHDCKRKVGKRHVARILAIHLLAQHFVLFVFCHSQTALAVTKWIHTTAKRKQMVKRGNPKHELGAALYLPDLHQIPNIQTSDHANLKLLSKSDRRIHGDGEGHTC